MTAEVLAELAASEGLRACGLIFRAWSQQPRGCGGSSIRDVLFLPLLMSEPEKQTASPLSSPGDRLTGQPKRVSVAPSFPCRQGRTGDEMTAPAKGALD
jgi:hypothetical protein